MPATLTPQPVSTEHGAEPFPVLDDLAFVCTGLVNVYFIGRAGSPDRSWFLVDAGIPGMASRIERAAARRYGAGSRPAAILLTHGHFDHVGSLQSLAETWDVPIYAHTLELPYLTGRSSYPPPDPTVGGGLLAALSFLFPRGPIDLGPRVRAFPEDGSIPDLPDWRWVHTPGHTPGHVSFYREADRALIAGDAFITTRQESALAVLTQEVEIHGPPKYFTPDWSSAGRSVQKLAALHPEVAATGHGLPLRGEAMRAGLNRLARNFEALAVPPHGRYVDHPATADASGVLSVPPSNFPATAAVAMGLTAGLLLGLALARPGRHS